MNQAIVRKRFFIFAGILLALWFLMLLGGYQKDISHFYRLTASSDMAVTPVLSPGDTVTQAFSPQEKYISSFRIHVAGGTQMNLSFVIEQDGVVLREGILSQTVTANEWVECLTEPIQRKAAGSLVVLRITAMENNDIQLFYGNMTLLSRGTVPLSNLTEETSLHYNGQPLDGRLNIETVQFTPYNVSGVIWIAIGASVVLLALLYWVEMSACRKNKSTLFSRLANAMHRYGFMLQQLVSRNFKSKYKRSVFGILWSFLNPLLTMLIQYVVFSTIFQSNIAYFPVYLLSGTICFSLFNEATTTGLSSISGNASLITKVYIPKYIFPLSCVISSFINFSMTLIPTLAVILLSGLPITSAYFFLPIVFLCLIMLCIGMVMLLSTIMVYFRDIQFLWGVMMTFLVYATPLFYPETIIPAKFSFILSGNPLYHIIRLFRYIIISGAPEPRAVLVCFLFNLFVLALGVSVFKSRQNDFILNL